MYAEPQIRAVLIGLAPRSAHGPYSRCVGYHHLVPGGIHAVAGPQPLWGMGSRINGGRFTPKDIFETIYLAEDPITALAEVALVIQHAQAPPATFRTPPWVHVTVDGILFSLLDLTENNVQRALGTNVQELTGEWRYTQAQGLEAPTQMLGRLCYETGRFDGIRYFSSKNPPKGVCLAVFPDRLGPRAYLEVYDPHDNLAQRLPYEPKAAGN